MKQLIHKVPGFKLVVEERKAVNATLYADDGRQIRTFSAVCNPVDTYDFLTGAKKAVEKIVREADLPRSQQKEDLEKIMETLRKDYRLKYELVKGTGFSTVLGTQHTVKRRPGYISKALGGFFVMTHRPGEVFPTAGNPSDLYLKKGGTFGPYGPEYFPSAYDASKAAHEAGLSPLALWS